MERHPFYFYLKIKRYSVQLEIATRLTTIRIIKLLDFEDYGKNKLCFYWNSAFDSWINFWEINQTGFQDTINFDGVIRHGIFGKLRFKLHRCIWKNSNFYFNRVQFRIENGKSVNT